MEEWTAPQLAALGGMGVEIVVMAGLGGRLLARFLRTGAPTGFIGIALLLGGTPSHALLTLSTLAGAPPSRGLWQLVYAGIFLGAGVGAVSVLRFAHEVFHPRSRLLSWLGTAVAACFAIVACTVPFSGSPPREHPAALATFAILFAIFGGTAVESLRAWARYRQVPGLDPAVVESFRLWGLAAFAMLATVALIRLTRGHALGLAAAGAVGLVCCGMLWLAFLPPAAWRRRLQARAPAVPPRAEGAPPGPRAP